MNTKNPSGPRLESVKTQEGSGGPRQRWKWATDEKSRSLILFEDGSAFEALATNGEQGDWVGLGKAATVWGEEGHEWRSYRTLPRALKLQ